MTEVVPAARPLVCVLGDLVEDVVVRLHGPLRRGSDAQARIERRPGGSAANVAAAVVARGGRCRFACRLGDDHLGDTLGGGLAAKGVELVAERGGATGSIVVLVDTDGERTMARDRGSTALLSGVGEAFLAGAGWLHLTMYSFEEGPVSRTAVLVARQACERGVPVSLDLSSVAVLDALGHRGVAAVLSEVGPSVVLANEDEARWLGAVGMGPEPFDALVVKRGREPAMVWRDGRMVRVPVPRALPGVDSTGAGDWFAAGFVLARCGGADDVTAAASGHRAACEGLLLPRAAPAGRTGRAG